eukprot:scaffold40527_cov25-Tisochrysis_lutea.AAC.1
MREVEAAADRHFPTFLLSLLHLFHEMRGCLEGARGALWSHSLFNWMDEDGEGGGQIGRETSERVRQEAEGGGRELNSVAGSIR